MDEEEKLSALTGWLKRLRLNERAEQARSLHCLAIWQSGSL